MIDWKGLLIALGRYLRLVTIWAGLIGFCYSIFLGVDLLGQGNHPAWVALQDHVSKHIAEYLGTLGVLSIGLVSTRPKLIPKSVQDWYDWIGNAIESAIPGRFRSPDAKNLPPSADPTKQTEKP